jgi:hypothetical protein
MADDRPVVMIELSDGTLHAPGGEHGVARCGHIMTDPWQIGPSARIAERARSICRRCFPQWGNA